MAKRERAKETGMRPRSTPHGVRIMHISGYELGSYQPKPERRVVSVGRWD